MDEHEVEVEAQPRPALSRERVLRTAVDLAERGGIESLSMRKLAQALDVVPMALYQHVANKDELLNALVDVVPGEHRSAARGRRLEYGHVARGNPPGPPAVLRHPWASRVMESRTTPTPVVLANMDSISRSVPDGRLLARTD